MDTAENQQITVGRSLTTSRPLHYAVAAASAVTADTSVS